MNLISVYRPQVESPDKKMTCGGFTGFIERCGKEQDSV